MSTPPAQPARGRGGRGRGGGRSRGGRGRGGGRGGKQQQQQQQQQPSGGRGNESSGGGEGRGNKEGRGRRSGRNSRGANKNKEDDDASKQTPTTTTTEPPPPTLTPEEVQEKKEQKERQQEEARQKAQAEKEAAAAAAAKKEKQAAFRDKSQQAVETLQSALETLQSHEQARATFEDESLAALRKSFAANKKSLKTDLKKCTAFVKKIKTGTAWSMKVEDIVKDVASLNLSRYVDEVVTAVVDAKPKLNDIATVVALCQAMHERYPEFLPPLKQQLWQTHIQNPPADAEATKTRRVFLRIWTELVVRGLLPETKNLVKLIASAAGAPEDRKAPYNVQDPPLVVAFCKQAGSEILGTTPASIREAMEWVQQDESLMEESEESTMALLNKGRQLSEALRPLLSNRAVSDEVMQVLEAHCRGAYHALVESLLQTYRKLLKLEKRCEQDRLLSGTLTEAREKGLTDARKLKENLFKATESLADVLDEKMPSLVSENNEDDEGGQGPGIEVLTKGDGEAADTGPFDDEETRAFYCDVPDFITTLPAALLNMSPEAVKAKQEENARKYGDLSEEAASSIDDNAELAPLTEAEMDEQEAENASTKEEEEETNEDTPRYKLMVLLEEELPESHRREQIDELSERFCSNHGSSKNSRKRLAKKLFLVPHARLDLLPFYSRMAASLDRVWSDIATPLVVDLEQQFHGQAKFKKNQNLEARLRTARYIGELIKFRVAPPMVFIRCVRRCLDDFTGANVDVCCALFESCGRYLYRLSHTHATVASLMESMTRLSKAKNLDERLQSLLKAAFFSVKPPPSGPKKKAKEYPPLEAYLRYLLMVKLEPTDASVSEISKELVRFPWSDPKVNCGALVCRIMLKACRRGRYKTIKAIAMVAASLRSQKGANEATVRLVDAVLEELRWALEHPNFRDQQRVLTYARLLGELFAISQVSGHVILDQLFDFIHLGHEIPEALREASKKLAESMSSPNNSQEQLPVYNSASGAVSDAAIAEDEEMEMNELETKKEMEPQPVAVSAASKYDPRVPSHTDPPNAVYRIKLVCTLLESSAKQLVTKKNLPRVKAFLADFQRYLFTKPVLPTEVEFALLDTFDVTESQWRRVTKSHADEKENAFPRYASWLEAHNAAVMEEEAEAALEKKKRLHMEALADPSNALVDIENIGDQELYEGSQEGSQQGSQLEEEDDEESRSYSLNHEEDGDHEGDNDDEDRKDDAEVNEGDYDDEEDEDYEDEEDEEEEFDEEAYMRQLEEEAFERELRRATMEALEKGKNTSRKLVAGDMISGSQIYKKKPLGSKPESSTETQPPSTFALSGQAGIGFQLLKRGNRGKVEAKEFVVPTDTNLAVVATRNDDAAARERNQIKQRVLQYEAESAEAELTGGNVYLEQEKLQLIRNKPLSMDEIDKNFGTTRGDLSASDRPRQASGGGGNAPSGGRGPLSSGRGPGGGGGRGRGRGGGRGRSVSGRTLFG